MSDTDSLGDTIVGNGAFITGAKWGGAITEFFSDSDDETGEKGEDSDDDLERSGVEVNLDENLLKVPTKRGKKKKGGDDLQ
jgi:hypothetical protein